MSKDVICREAAAEIVRGWEDHFDTVLSPETSEKLVWTVMKGRLNLDEATSTFTLKLRTAVQLENGKAVDELTIREPTAKEVRGVGRDGGEVAQVIRILSAVSGQPLGIIERLKLKDLTVCGEIFNFFG